MAKIIIIHHDDETRETLARTIADHHEVIAAANINAGLKGIRKYHPALGVGGLEAKQLSLLTLLKHMKENEFKMPMLVAANADAGEYQPAALKLGAKAFFEVPVEPSRLLARIAMVIQEFYDKKHAAVPISPAEENGNLTEIERTLNRQMRCFAGKNQVFLQSLITGSHKTKPRICLKCPLRKEFGYTERIYHDYIRDVCVGDHEICPAVRKFQERAGL